VAAAVEVQHGVVPETQAELHRARDAIVADSTAVCAIGNTGQGQDGRLTWQVTGSEPVAGYAEDIVNQASRHTRARRQRRQ
jgi:hypothetical protein